MSDTEQKTEGEQQVETPELSRILPLGMYFFSSTDNVNVDAHDDDIQN